MTPQEFIIKIKNHFGEKEKGPGFSSRRCIKIILVLPRWLQILLFGI